MSQLLESIRIENRELQHIELHNQRFNYARAMLFGAVDYIRLEKVIQIPFSINNERYKCRVISKGNEISFEIAPYRQRPVEKLKIVKMNQISYTYKTDDRTQLNRAFAARETADDVIIIKNGFVTDSYAANLLFFDGKKWYTPDTPLLKGTQREFLLSEGFIEEQKIELSELIRFKSVKLINAMIDFERAPEILIPDGILF